jgi:hypothetical protein
MRKRDMVPSDSEGYIREICNGVVVVVYLDLLMSRGRKLLQVAVQSHEFSRNISGNIFILSSGFKMLHGIYQVRLRSTITMSGDGCIVTLISRSFIV